ncbi:MAG: pitrilysin family protein [Acidobacteriota bacterium]|jgi:predicted Zn-dependent peptidase|nr:pitrilysin family protein [Acidobacteriota bacterium]
MKSRVWVALILLATTWLAAADFDPSRIQDRIHEFTLENGLKFILLEDHSVPIASFVTFVNVGGSDERIGIFGISHFLEHLAFKGTSEVGTTDIKAERRLMAEMDQVFDRILAEKDSLEPDQARIDALNAELEKLKQEAGRYVKSNDFTAVLTRNGVVGLNAGTSKDYTVYFYSLPSNRLELWAYLESARFTDPVFREFYKERGVIMEERRVVTENQPTGKLIEELQAIAFKDHPYHVSVIGPMSNIEHITRKDVYDYFHKNYHAGNMVVGVAGDVTPKQLRSMADKYFARIPAGKPNPLVFTDEKTQLGEKTVTIFEETQPWLVLGYHIPSQTHPDFTRVQVLNYLLTTGRSSRLNQRMVKQEKSALAVASFAGFPGSKYPGLYLVLALPNSGKTTDELLTTIDEEVEKLKNEPVSAEELDSAKTRMKVSVMRQMQNDLYFMMGLLQSEMLQGSWRKTFDAIKEIDAVTAEDIRELAGKYLLRSNRTIARIEKKQAEKEEVSK